jgi:carbon storage regulator CsrA
MSSDGTGTGTVIVERLLQERVRIGRDIEVQVIGIKRGRVKLRVTAPVSVRIERVPAPVYQRSKGEDGQ